VKKNTAKRIWIITIFLLIILGWLLLKNKCFAISDVTTWENWEPNIEDSETLKGQVEGILVVVRMIGIITSVATLSIIGIKFMLGSVEEKANYKKILLPWGIGAIMVFAITFIPSILYDVAKSTVNFNYEAAEKNTENWNSFISGYDTAQADAYLAIMNYRSIEEFFNKYVDKKNTEYSENSKSNHTPYNRGLREGIEDIWFYFQGKTTLTTAGGKEFFVQITSVRDKIKEGEITKDTINSEIEKYNGATANSIKAIQRTRLKIQQSAWEGTTYLYTNPNASPAI